MLKREPSRRRASKHTFRPCGECAFREKHKNRLIAMVREPVFLRVIHATVTLMLYLLLPIHTFAFTTLRVKSKSQMIMRFEDIPA